MFVIIMRYLFQNITHAMNSKWKLVIYSGHLFNTTQYLL